MSEHSNILVGVTGGIAAYKACELVRLLKKDGASVRVMMTEGAQQFVGPMTFEALTGEPVRTALFDRDAEAAMSHIELARWADVVVITPASANSVARLAQGLADDLISTVCLATDAPVLVAPAMNAVMWEKPVVQQHVASLHKNGVHVLMPDSGEQACGEIGAGRLPEPAQIKDAIVSLIPEDSLAGIRAIVTAGPTREPIDAARFISNYSTGHMGCALAAALRRAGATVTLIHGPLEARIPPGVEAIAVATAKDMRRAVNKRLGQCELLIAAAAVADWKVPTVSAEKGERKKGRILALVPTEDILAEVGALPERPFLVGFAAEVADVEMRGRAKRTAKGADLIVANQIGPDAGFGDRDTTLTVIDETNTTTLGPSAKNILARELVQLISTRMPRTRDPQVIRLHV